MCMSSFVCYFWGAEGRDEDYEDAQCTAMFRCLPISAGYCTLFEIKSVKRNVGKQ